MSDITGAWYLPVNHPSDTSSTVGGAIDLANPIQGTLNELFPVEGYVPFLGQTDQTSYRKLFFRNLGNTITQAKAFWADIEHAEQMEFAFEQSASDTAVNEATIPVGYVAADFNDEIGLIDGVDIPNGGTLTGMTNLGFWVRRTIPAGISPDTGAFANLAIAGVVSA